MGQPRSAVRDDSGDHVEANLDRSRAPFGQPRSGGSADPDLLLVPDGFCRQTPAVGRARLHLAEHDETGTASDEIHLDTSRPEIALDGEPVPAIQLGCRLLTCSAEPGAFMHPSKLWG